jgi:hypothetical protein
MFTLSGFTTCSVIFSPISSLKVKVKMFMKVKALHAFMLGPDYPAMQYLIPEEQNL